MLTPGPEEWAIKAALKMNPAALIGRPGSYATASCGGALLPEERTAIGLILTAEIRRVRGASTPDLLLRTGSARLALGGAS